MAARQAVRRGVLALLVGSFAGLGATTAGLAADNRTLDLYNTHTKERLTITFKKNGKYVASSLKELNRFLRDWRRNEPTNMDPRLFDTVWEVYTRSGSRQPVHVVSAYRSPKTNEMLRSKSRAVAKHSQHTLGKAMDLFLPDVRVSKLREIGVGLQRGGVGFYPNANNPFVHIDVGSVRAWPRMTRDQLVRIFPDGKTVHLPSDGKPLPGYQQALAELKRNGGVRPLAIADEASSSKKKVGLLAMLFGDEEDETEELNAASGEGPVLTAPAKAEPAPARVDPAPVVVAAPPPPPPAPVVVDAPAGQPLPFAVEVAAAPPPPPAKPKELLALAAASAARAAETVEPAVTVALVDASVKPRPRPDVAVAEDAPVQIAATGPLPLPPAATRPARSDEPVDAQSALAEVARAEPPAIDVAALGYASATDPRTLTPPRAASLTRGGSGQSKSAARGNDVPAPAVFGEKADPLAAFARIELPGDLPVYDAGQTTYRGVFARMAHPNQRSGDVVFTTPTVVVVAGFDRRPYGQMTSTSFSGVSLSRVPVVHFRRADDLAMR